MAPSRLIVFACLLALGGCGGDGAAKDPVERLPASVQAKVRAAQEVDLSAFPQPAGRGIEDIANDFDTGGPQAALASSIFRTGSNRLAFGVLDVENRFVYGDTVLYLVPAAGGQVRGPIPAPADVLVTEPRFRSQQAASEKDPFAAVYAADVKFDKPGIWNALIVTDAGAGRRVAATLDFEVVSPRKDRIPDVGERAPRVETDTLASARGNAEAIDTRIPPAEELHRKSLDDVLGSKPVALVFATPQLCQSRVCGPVVDIALQLRAKYGDRVEFIHQEVYRDNDPNKGLRPPLEAFNLPSEPWLFAIGDDGRVKARLEGSFGLNAFEAAVKAAL